MIKKDNTSLIFESLTKIDKNVFKPLEVQKKAVETAEKVVVSIIDEVEAYKKAIKDSENRIKDYKERKKQTEGKIEKAKEQIIKEKEKLKDLEKNGDKIRKETLKKLSEKISRLAIDELMIGENELVFITKPLKIEEFAGDEKQFSETQVKKYKLLGGIPIGRFICYLNLASEQPQLRARSLDFEAGDYSHAFIQAQQVCFGISVRILKKWWDKRDYANIIELVLELLISPIDDDGFTRWHTFLENRRKLNQATQKKIISYYKKALETKTLPLSFQPRITAEAEIEFKDEEHEKQYNEFFEWLENYDEEPEDLDYGESEEN